MSAARDSFLRCFALVTFALASLCAAPSCRHTHPVPEPGNSGGEVSRPELPDAEQISLAEVSGTVMLAGLTLDGSLTASATGGGGFTGGGGGAIGPGGSAPGVLIKIYNPGDDILRQTVTGANGSYKLTLDTAVVGKLSVQMQVVEDLDGDGQGGDTVTQVVPVNLAVGKAATVNFSFAYGASAPSAGGGLFPPDQLLLTVDIQQQDLNGDRRDFLAQGPNGELVIDKDGDQFLEPGDDAVYVDANHNGVPDNYEAIDTPVSGSPGQDYIEGLVSSVDLAALTFVLDTPDGGSLTIALSPFAGVFPLEDALGTYLGEVPFDASLVGRHVAAFGTKEEQRFVADLVVLFPLTDPAGGGGLPPGR